MVDSERTRIRGAMVLNFLAAAREQFGESAVETSLSRIEREHQRVLTEALAVSYVPIVACEELLYALANVLERDVYEINRELNARATTRTVTTVWRLLLRLASVEQMLGRSSTYFGKTYDQGALEVLSVERGRATLQVSGRQGMSQLAKEGFAVGVEAILRAKGLARVSSEIAPRVDGLTLTIRWD